MALNLSIEMIPDDMSFILLEVGILIFGIISAEILRNYFKRRKIRLEAVYSDN